MKKMRQRGYTNVDFMADIFGTSFIAAVGIVSLISLATLIWVASL